MSLAWLSGYVVGSIPHAEMPLWQNLAEAVVMVPRSDGMPNSLLEAMACGAVPVLNRLPQYAELIRHGENGLFVDPDGGTWPVRWWESCQIR
jgi:glycosyltransferase involved in cell wall biosynthesis